MNLFYFNITPASKSFFSLLRHEFISIIKMHINHSPPLARIRIYFSRFTCPFTPPSHFQRWECTRRPAFILDMTGGVMDDGGQEPFLNALRDVSAPLVTHGGDPLAGVHHCSYSWATHLQTWRHSLTTGGRLCVGGAGVGERGVEGAQQ